MLDVRKAFDSVWQEGLFVKLYNASMDPKVWRIVTNMYAGLNCSVRVGQNKSKWFTAWQGIIQGGPFSMFNYEVMNNDLLVDLKGSNAGVVLGNHKTTSPAFADDQTVIAPTRSALQRLLNQVFSICCLWR